MPTAFAILFLAAAVYWTFQFFSLIFRRSGAGRKLLIGTAVMIGALIAFGLTVAPATEARRAALTAPQTEAETQHTEAQVAKEVEAEEQRRER